MNLEDRDVTYTIIEHIGVLQHYGSGWKLELNLVSWNGGAAKYDIRSWDESHIRMSRGVILTKEDTYKLKELLNSRGEI